MPLLYRIYHSNKHGCIRKTCIWIITRTIITLNCSYDQMSCRYHSHDETSFRAQECFFYLFIDMICWWPYHVIMKIFINIMSYSMSRVYYIIIVVIKEMRLECDQNNSFLKWKGQTFFLLFLYVILVLIGILYDTFNTDKLSYKT